MRKALYFLMFFLTISSWSQVIQIGAGASTSNAMPIFGFYDYNISQ